jgi:hypothetical protein
MARYETRVWLVDRGIVVVVVVFVQYLIVLCCIDFRF